MPNTQSQLPSLNYSSLQNLFDLNVIIPRRTSIPVNQYVVEVLFNGTEWVPALVERIESPIFHVLIGTNSYTTEHNIANVRCGIHVCRIQTPHNMTDPSTPFGGLDTRTSLSTMTSTYSWMPLDTFLAFATEPNTPIQSQTPRFGTTSDSILKVGYSMVELLESKSDVMDVFVQRGSSDDTTWEACRFYFNIPSTEVHEMILASINDKNLFDLEPRANNTKFTHVVTLQNHLMLPHLVGSRGDSFKLIRVPTDEQPQFQEESSCYKIEMFEYAYQTTQQNDFMDRLAVASVVRHYFGPHFDTLFASSEDFCDAMWKARDPKKFRGTTRIKCDAESLISYGQEMIRQNDCTSPYARYVIVVGDDCMSAPLRSTRFTDSVCDNFLEKTETNPNVLLVAVFPFDPQCVFLFRNGSYCRVNEREFQRVILANCDMESHARVEDFHVVSVKRYFDNRPDVYVMGNDTEIELEKLTLLELMKELELDFE